MADSERKRLVWDIKKTLLTLSLDELFQIAKSVGAVPGTDESRVNPTDEEGCFEYICSFMSSGPLLEISTDLLNLREVIDTVSQGRTSQVAVAIDVSGSGDDVSHVNDNVNPTDESDATDFGIASATHMTPSTASDTHDTELQKMLTSYEELSKKIMQYKHTPTPQSVPQSFVKIGLTTQSSNVAGTK